MPIKVQLIGADALERIGRLAAGAKATLMGQIVEASKKFGTDAVSYAKTKYLSGPRPQRLGHVSGILAASIATTTKQDGNVVSTRVGSNVVYAPIHEFGGVVRPTVTDKMRKFAWAMFFKTGDGKWKATALTAKNRLQIKIPARPFLRPAVQDAMPSFEENLRRILSKLNFRAA